jgi:hypothetical protein
MLYKLYCQLAKNIPDDCNHLFGNSFVKEYKYWLSIDAQAQPHILFKTTPDYDGSDLKLKFIDVEFSRDCEILLHGNTKTSGVYTIVRLNENDPDLVRIFLRLLEESLCQGSIRPKAQDIRKHILELSNLFSLVEISVTDIIGLWGELFVINSARNLENAVRSWCQHKMAKFDFVTNDSVLEVKSTLRPTRKHRLSLEQVRPSESLESFVISLMLVEVPSGARISEQMDAIYESISDADLRREFFLKCLIKGGKDIYGNEMKIGVLPGGMSVAVFSTSSIPAPIIESGDPITSLRFDVDLSEIQTVSKNQHDILLRFSK